MLEFKYLTMGSVTMLLKISRKTIHSSFNPNTRRYPVLTFKTERIKFEDMFKGRKADILLRRMVLVSARRHRKVLFSKHSSEALCVRTF